MARNSIGDAVESQGRSGVERLRETGRLQYRAVKPQAAQQNNSLSDALKNFGNSAVELYGTHRAIQKTKADERSNEIIRKLSPEQRREATANNTLLYQDDPDAMTALRFKSGRNAAFEVENEIKERISLGKFKTQEELSEYRRERMEQKAIAYADAAGIAAGDEDYQRGFNDSIADRDNTIFDVFAQQKSAETQAMAEMEATSDLGSMFNDEQFLTSETGTQDFVDYINYNLSTGSIPTTEMAIGVLGRSLSDNSTQPGADVFMKNVGEREVMIRGQAVKVRDLVGPEVLEGYQVKAAEATFKRNRVATQEFTFGIQDATHQTDPNVGLQQLQGLQEALYKRQPGGMVTAQSQALDSARAALLGRISAESAKSVQLMDETRQGDNRAALFEHKYTQRIAGNTVSTDWKTFESDEQTGEFSREDASNFAINKMAEIDRMTISPQDKDKLRLQYLRADVSEDGPFRTHFSTLTTEAANQFNGLVVAETAEVNEDSLNRVREFQRIYETDPATVGALYPEQVALVERISLMERSGIGIETLIDAERRQKDLTKEETALQETKWANLLNGSDAAVPYLPAPLKTAARTLFMSELYRTGDESAAKNTVNSWLDKTTVRFGTSKNTRGAVQKRTLMVDPQDPTSWKAGEAMIQRVISEVAAAKPWVNAEDITITETPSGIYLTDPMSSLNIPVLTPQMLQREYQMDQVALRAQIEGTKTEQADQKIDQYKAEQQRRDSLTVPGIPSAMGTLEGAAGFVDD
jgi:hypothetical protein